MSSPNGSNDSPGRMIDSTTFRLAKIVLNNRSMLEVLYFFSAYVQVPEA